MDRDNDEAVDRLVDIRLNLDWIPIILLGTSCMHGFSDHSRPSARRTLMTGSKTQMGTRMDL